LGQLTLDSPLQGPGSQMGMIPGVNDPFHGLGFDPEHAPTSVQSLAFEDSLDQPLGNLLNVCTL
jgi:hypothetical protein